MIRAASIVAAAASTASSASELLYEYYNVPAFRDTARVMRARLQAAERKSP